MTAVHPPRFSMLLPLEADLGMSDFRVLMLGFR